ncbi:hypothetical protein LR48_Vigan176s000800 [Vigna angularis]|uniref:Uncharacterized protein n=1 Tax=Phaseolus angularis TaxID=3914 RepID=A0A0L9T550_PHAAN|nr:hypothetical protein LR48_Vigan176s000800 [Vigna angularis]
MKNKTSFSEAQCQTVWGGAVVAGVVVAATARRLLREGESALVVVLLAALGCGDDGELRDEGGGVRDGFTAAMEVALWCWRFRRRRTGLRRWWSWWQLLMMRAATDLVRKMNGGRGGCGSGG